MGLPNELEDSIVEGVEDSFHAAMTIPALPMDKEGEPRLRPDTYLTYRILPGVFDIELSEGCCLLVCKVAGIASLHTPLSTVAWYPPAFSAVHAVYVGVHHV